MAFGGGDAIVNAAIQLELFPPSNTQIDSVATQAANRFNQSFNQGVAQGASRATSAINTRLASVSRVLQNVTSGFQFLGQVIGARLPQQVTSAANTIANRLGQALGTVQGAFGRVQQSASGLFSAIESGSAGAAVAVGALIGIAVKITQSFAGIADAARSATLGVESVINATGGAAGAADQLIGKLRSIGSELGVDSAQLISTSQSFLALGFSVDQTTGLLEAASTAAARLGANNAQLSRVLVGLQQIQAKGRLSAQELNQQIAQNIPGIINQARVFEILADRLNISVDAVRSLQEQGQITSDQALPAIQQAMEELNEGVDILGIRMSTLSGALAIVRENFNQIIATNFQTFINALLPAIRPFIEGLQEAAASGTGPLAGFIKNLQQFGTVIGESLGQVLTEVGPLLPQFFNIFKTLIEALAPVVVDLISTFTTLARIILPVVQVVANALKLLTTGLGPVSFLIRQITAGLLTGGLIKAFGIAGRALGSFGGFIGRIATPLSRFLETLAGFGPAAAKLVTSVGILRGPIEGLIGLLESLVGTAKRVFNFLGNLPGIKQAVNAIDGFINKNDELKGGLEKTGEEILSHPLFGTGAFQTAATVQKLTELNKKFTDTLKTIIDGQNEIISINKAVRDAEQNLTDVQNDRVKAIQAVKDAELDKTETEEKVIDIDRQLNELNEERNRLINDTVSDIREIAAAERDLERVNIRLIDLDQDRAEVLAEIAELQKPATAEELASAERKIERARLAVSDAIREEAEFLRQLNQEQQTSIDLTGLSLDQLRTTLAGLRAQAAAQRAVGRVTRSQEEIDAERTELRLNVLDAEENVNEAIADRDELLNRVANNQDRIRELTDRLKTLELDRLDILDQQREAVENLTALRNGETTRARELRDVEKEIRDTQNQRKDAVLQVEQATIRIREREAEVRSIDNEIKNAQIAIRDAKLEQRLKTAEILGDERAINQALLDRIGLNKTLVGQSQELITNALIQQPDILRALISNLPRPRGPVPRDLEGRPLPGAGVLTAEDIARLLLNEPNKLRELLRRLGLPFAEGGVITKPIIARMGEGSKHEMILPLTKPDRVWSLLSQTLPKYPGALRAAQEAISAGPSVPLPKVVSSGNRVQRRNDGPATYGQIQELINLLSEHRTEVRIEAPINIEGHGNDDLLARKISKKVKNDVLEELNKRR